MRIRTLAVIAFASLGLMGMSLGCDKSPAGPTSTASVSVTAVSPRAGLSGQGVTVAGTGFQQGATLTLDGVAATVIRVTSVSITAISPVHPAGAVDVVVTNPGGQSATLTGGYTFEVISLIASPDRVSSGGQLTLNWLAPSGRGCIGGGDWVAIYKVGDPDNTGAANGHSDLWFTHLCGATSGKATLSAPTEPGQYEFRYMVGDASAAHSSPITVTAAGGVE